MSLYGALFSGVSALTAQSQSMAMISDNIANVNTVGYKRSEAAFSSLVTAQTRSTAYNSGAVKASTLQRIDQQGVLQQSSSGTDMAISGNGFFVVKNSVNDGLQAPFYTRAGQFSEDSKGYLVNPQGKYLMGWPVDQDGNLTSGSGDLNSLAPVDVAFLGGITRPTTKADISLNLNSKEVNYKYPLATPATQAANFSRGITVYDSLGQSQDVTMKFFKTTSPTATAAGGVNVKSISNLMDTFPDIASTATFTSGFDITPNLGALAPSLQAGDTFNISMNGESAAIAVDPSWTATDFVAAINAAFTGSPASVSGSKVSLTADTAIDVKFGGTQPILESNLNAIGFSYSHTPRDARTFTVQAGTNPVQTVSIADGDSAADVVAKINNLPNINAQFDAGGNIVIASDASGSSLVLGGVGGGAPQLSVAGLANLGLSAATYPSPSAPTLLTQLSSTPNAQNWWQVEVSAPDGTILKSGMVNFDGDGKINSNTNPATIGLTNVSWGNGSSAQNIDININNFTQYAGNYNVIAANQNGAELGLRTSVSVDKDGYVIASFSNGENAKLYKLPIATFANANGLTAKSGNIYQESTESGEYNLREAGQGSAGVIESGSLEASNVDIADEFSKMIVTQRAYSAGTKVITTADQMLQELLQLR